MILTVTLNPALDVTYWVDRLVPQSATRVRSVRTRAGGKGLNVARVAAAVTEAGSVRVTGLTGGPRGEAIRKAVAALGIREAFEMISGESRQTIAIVGERGAPTELREPGPEVTLAEWESFRRRFRALASDSRVVVLSGSLPPGVPDDAYATLTREARGSGARVLVDADGAALLAACAAEPELVKPNEDELRRVTTPGSNNGSLGRTERVLGSARALRARGAGAVVASLGQSGLVTVTADAAFRASHPRVDGNPVGAGDALVAGLALALAAGGTLGPADMARASGLAMASVLGSGDVDLGQAERLAGVVRVRRIGDQP